MNWTRIRKQLSKRSAIVGAGVAGFVVGAGGLVAAQIDDSPSAEIEVEAERSADDSRPGSTVGEDRVPTAIDLTIPAVTAPRDTVGDDTVTDDTIDDHGGDRDGSDDSTSSSVPGNTVPSNTVPSNTIPSNTTDDHGGDRDRDDSDDDSTSSSVPGNTVPSNTVDDHGGDRERSDDDSTSSSVPASLPAAFSRSYESAGGSIEVTWNGTAFVLDSVSPAPGFSAEIEHQSWDRIRVDFEGDADARIEVRLNDGRIEVGIG